jgi:broad specificity phosphatase PhoE
MIPFRTSVATREIVFVRHAESQANVDGVWNGQTDGPLSAEGEESLGALGERLSEWEFDRVISSPLSRTRQTAASFADSVETVDEFIEVDMGEWEGRRFSEIQASDGEALKKAIASRTVPMGRTGETLDQVVKRALAAVDRLFESMGDDEKVAVVTHGGFLQSVLHRHLAGKDGRRAHVFTSNTGISRLLWQFGCPRLASFNDTGHLGPRSGAVTEAMASGDDVLALIRHGRTKANVEKRWQGHGDWDLDELGDRQVAALGEWYGTWPTVYTSPLSRAASTAAKVALNGVTPVEGLKEISMGNWEGLTTSEIFERWPNDMEKIFRYGVDLPRGETGETWAQLTKRFSDTVNSLDKALSGPTIVVAHGGAIRSYISSLTATTDTHAGSLSTPANASVTHVALRENGPEILDYSVAPHLDRLQ